MITPAQIRRFQKLCKGLNDLMHEVCKDTPEAGLYLANNSLNLMSGPAHDYSSDCRPLQDNSVACVSIFRADGGDW